MGIITLIHGDHHSIHGDHSSEALAESIYPLVVTAQKRWLNPWKRCFNYFFQGALEIHQPARISRHHQTKEIVMTMGLI
jgi:hypothetical protein